MAQAPRWQKTVVARTSPRAFNPNLHPRGRDGKFIEKFGFVRFTLDGRPARGQVVEINERETRVGQKRAELTVRVDSDTPGKLRGETRYVNVDPRTVTSVASTKGRVDTKPAVEKPKKLVGANGKPLGYVPGRPDPNTKAGQEILQKQAELFEEGEKSWAYNSNLFFEVLFEENEDVKKIFDELGITLGDFIRGHMKDALDEHLREEMTLAAQQPVVVNMPSGALRMLFADGRYKSQFETDVSQGRYDHDRRREEEEVKLGVPRRIKRENRPVYGVANTPARGVPTDQTVYGDVALELKDTVRDRSTISAYDTFRSGLAFPVDGLNLQPGDGVKMAWSIYVDPLKGWDEGDNNAALINGLRRAGATEDQIQQVLSAPQPDRHKYVYDSEIGEFVVRDLYKPRPIGGALGKHDYREVQIHGGFSVDDIAAIWVPDLAAVPPEIVDAAAKAGVPLKQADAPIPQRRLPDA